MKQLAKTIRKHFTGEITNSKEPIPVTDAVIQRTLAPYGVPVSAQLAGAIRCYIELLLLWNQKINLTAIRKPREILERHFGESIFAAHAVAISAGRLADLGSGAGFPGLALKLVCPGLTVQLIEANTKKAVFLSEVCRVLNLSGVEILCERSND